MHSYQYLAWNKAGQKTKGTCEASNLKEAINLLNQQDLWIEKINKKFIKKSIKPKEITEFFLNLARMQKSGLSLIQALGLLEKNRNLKTCLINIRKKIESGESLGSALLGYPKYFDALSIEWIRAGEKTGRLEESLCEIAAWRIRKSQVQKQIKKALTYPLIVLLIMLGVLWILMVFVIPSFEKMFASFSAELPILTRMVIGVSGFISQWGILIIVGILGGGIGMIFLIKKNRVLQILLDHWALIFPGLGFLNYHMMIFRTLGILGVSIKAGLPLFEAMNSAIAVTKNKMIKQALGQAKSRIWEGWPLSQALEESGYFYMDTLSLLKISEASGTQDQILERLAVESEEILKSTLDKYLSLLEPVLMILVGGLVGVVVVAMYGPIFQLGNLV